MKRIRTIFLFFVNMALLLTGILLSESTQAIADETADEQLLLAAFTFNVTKFVTWNQRSSLKETSAPIHIGVLQNATLFSKLQSLTSGKSIDAHAIIVEKLDASSITSSNATDVVVLIPDTGKVAQGTLKKLKGCKCLLITNGESTDQFGSVINFYSEDAHLRFTIDMERAKDEGLELSSQLLKLGKIL